jgi:hypothetical protein
MARINGKVVASEDVLPAVIGKTLQSVSADGRGLELTLTAHEEELLAAAAKGLWCVHRDVYSDYAG